MRASRQHTARSACDAAASASKVPMPTTGTLIPNAMPCATPHAMRNPVNEPGPAPNAMQSRSAALNPLLTSSASIIGSSSSEWRWPASVSRASTSPSSHSAAEQSSVEVSNARIFKGRTARAEGTSENTDSNGSAPATLAAAATKRMTNCRAAVTIISPDLPTTRDYLQGRPQSHHFRQPWRLPMQTPEARAAESSRTRLVGFHDLQGRESLQVVLQGDWCYVGHLPGN